VTFEGHFGYFPNNTTERRAVSLRQLSFLLYFHLCLF